MLRLTLALMMVAAFSLQTPFAQTPTVQGLAELPLFAVEIRIGAKWEPSKPPQEQSFFKEHSGNLKRLRDAGRLIVGARYSDVGLIVLAAESAVQVKAMMDEDPSIRAGVFTYQVHAFNVFYPGTLQTRSPR